MATFPFDHEVEVTGGPEAAWAAFTDVPHVRVSGGYAVTGRAATLGASSIERKGDKIVDENSVNLSRELAAP